MALTLESLSMLRPTIRKRILGIALGLIFLMAITSALSTVMTRRIAHQLDEFSGKYVEAYGHLARVNIRSLERSLAMRRMMGTQIMQATPDPAATTSTASLTDIGGKSSCGTDGVQPELFTPFL